jgi:hypothetical protein
MLRIKTFPGDQELASSYTKQHLSELSLTRNALENTLHRILFDADVSANVD